ncbi:HAD domain-containing protein [Lacrimispora sphenoides]|uniref:HAD domain-containing protein n=1 Tax=Lacrimispora sphenoides TaxID=29370 RepID=UPI003A7F5715
MFLDIDGVLNCQSSKSKCNGLIGIDNDKVNNLADIVKHTEAKIVLCSSWKDCWERVNKEDQHVLGNYLDKKLRRKKLFIFDKTTDDGSNRGDGITNWLNNVKAHHKVESWIVIDDEIFKDYDHYGIMKHLVKTEFYNSSGGLQCEHVGKAIQLLNNCD